MNFKHFAEDIDSIIARDPAARSRLEVALTYPGFHAILAHRLSHALWVQGWRVLARVISQAARWITGIEIHPGATIGRRLFIDHGMGVVVGETAEIGDDVTMYQDITLGGTSPSVNSAAQANKKRHPTLRDRVIVGAGAQVLGAITVGHGAKVGANAVVVTDVPPGALMVGIPAKIAAPRGADAGDFAAYGLPNGVLPDPVARAIEGLMDQVARLQGRVALLEGELNGRVVRAASENGAERIPGTGDETGDEARRSDFAAE
ncbi:MAG TPA: serine O-acetyltransferase [Dongiaceae bacterium]|nr:serine O-acetyltransferase [Dongiaceae bacterium]